ncbi:MAG: hypothetical protein ACH350_08065 [Parachlamydiaceae bacterium]
MKKIFCLFLLIFSLRQLDATVIDLNQICQNKEHEVAEFYVTDKSDNSFDSYFFGEELSTWIYQATLLSSEGYFLVDKDSLENTEQYIIHWKDINGSEYDLNAILVSEHPTKNVAIVKTDPPFGAQFPQPKLSFNCINKNEWVMVVINELSEGKCYFQLGKVIDVIQTTESDPEALYGIIGLQIRLGQTGCPVYDAQGEVVGFIHGSTENELIALLPFSSIQTWIEDVIGVL